MLATFAVGQVLWSMLWFFLFVMWMMLIFSVIGDLYRDREASGAAKVLWTIFIIFLPFLGVFLYLIVRGNGMADRAMQQAQANDAQMRAYVQSAAGGVSSADELAKLADLRDKGAISDAEFAAMKAKVLNG